VTLGSFSHFGKKYNKMIKIEHTYKINGLCHAHNYGVTSVSEGIKIVVDY